MARRRMRMSLTWLVAPLLALLLGACTAGPVGLAPTLAPERPADGGDGEQINGQQRETMEMTGTNWILVYTVVGGDATVPVPASARVSFTIAEGRVSGNSGCNRFSGPVTLEGDSINFGPLASTRMACAEELMRLEEAVLDLLGKATRFTASDGELRLYNAEGLPLALFIAEQEAEEAAALLGREWQWVGFEDTAGRKDIVVDHPGSYTIEFMRDGTYAFRADCNSGSGNYRLNGSSIDIQPGAMTLIACGEESLDTEFLRLLGDVTTFVIADDGTLYMNLMLDAGNMVFTAAD